MREEPDVAERRAPEEIGSEQQKTAERRARAPRPAPRAGIRRDAGEERREQRLIDGGPPDEHGGQQQHGRQRRFDDVVAAVIPERVDIRARPIDPGAAVPERVGE